MIIPKHPQTVGDVAGHYDDLDVYYRELWGEHLHHGLWLTETEPPEVAVRQLIQLVAAHLELRTGDQVCDIGCGYGGTARYLAGEHQARVFGFTVSERQYQFATQSSLQVDSPQFYLQDWTTNQLEDESMDRVVSIECVSHLENKRAFFEQIHRVLKPGGRAVMTVWLATSNPLDWQRKHLLEPICREGRLPSMGTWDDYRRMLDESGLEVLSFHELSPFVRKTWSICTKRVALKLLTSREARQFVFSNKTRHAVFLVSVARILVAYYTKAMQYGLAVFRKPDQGSRDEV